MVDVRADRVAGCAMARGTGDEALDDVGVVAEDERLLADERGRDGLAGLRLMAKIREFERRMPLLSEEGLIRGSTHPSVGIRPVTT